MTINGARMIGATTSMAAAAAAAAAMGMGTVMMTTGTLPPLSEDEEDGAGDEHREHQKGNVRLARHG